MTLKDKIYIGIIAVLLILVLIHKNVKESSFKEKNDKLKDSIALQYKKIDSLTIAQRDELKQIDSLKDVRTKIKIKYKTIYEEYKTKDSLVNSLSIDSILQLWAKRYHLYQAK